jgi:hypothetical protein
MSRSNGLTYVRETLIRNAPIFKNCSLCIYVNETDLAELQPELDGLTYTVIPRTTDDSALHMLKNGRYWEAHICMDFMYSMTVAIGLHIGCKYFMWLEDDVLLHPRFIDIWNSRGNFGWTANGHGATCIISEVNHLVNHILPTIKTNYLIAGHPLDLMYDLYGKQTPLREKVAFHIGVQSSNTSIRHQDDRNEYNRVISKYK